MQIEWSTHPRADLEAISGYIEHDRNLETANRVARTIYEAAQRSRALPHAALTRVTAPITANTTMPAGASCGSRCLQAAGAVRVQTAGAVALQASTRCRRSRREAGNKGRFQAAPN